MSAVQQGMPQMLEAINKPSQSIENLKPSLLPETLNQGAQDMKYDVRGEIYHAAQQRLSQGKEVIFTNVGNPHQLGEKPLTFPRQVVALCSWPTMLNDPDIISKFPPDAVRRAKSYLERMQGGIGAYSDSRGHICIREEVASFITRRDAPAPAASEAGIFITNGAGAGVTMFLHTIIRDNNDCILAPIPQYPLYSACVARLEVLSWGITFPRIALGAWTSIACNAWLT